MCYQQVVGTFSSSSAYYTVYYGSGSDINDFQNSVRLEAETSGNRISSILIPNNFTEQQLQVQVGLTIIIHEGPRSTPLTVGKTIQSCYCIAI